MSRTTIETSPNGRVQGHKAAATPASASTGGLANRIASSIVRLRFLAPWLVLVAVGFAATVPYRSSLHAYFTGDDFGLIHLFYYKGPLHFITLFWQPWVERLYGPPLDELRPLVAASYQFDSLGGPDNPLNYHLTNMLLHAACAGLVVGICRIVCRLGWLSCAFAGALFAMMPSQAETVSWISGRADSIPALFYLGTFLCYALWRRTGRQPLYFAALFAFFLGLFSKQSAITMPATLILYDMVTERWLMPRSWPPIRQLIAWYAPFLLLLACYLTLRYFLFATVIREQQITGSSLTTAALIQATFFRMLAIGTGKVDLEGPVPLLVLAAIPLTFIVLGFRAFFVERIESNRRWMSLFYFGPAWWIISVAPLTVTYPAVRHLYLASAGVAITMAVVFDIVSRQARGRGRVVAVAAALALFLWSRPILQDRIFDWNDAAAMSREIATRVREEAATAPPGSLLVVDVPASNFGTILSGPLGNKDGAWTWIWSWALPYAVLPPFSPPEVSTRVNIISSSDVYCCPPGEWLPWVQKGADAWARHVDDPPVVALRWDTAIHRVHTISSVTRPGLAAAARHLVDANTPDELEFLFQNLLREAPVPYPVPRDAQSREH
jgi:hypothetical protein